MKVQQPAILIPDECINPLPYYVIRCLKAANKDCQINLLVSSQKLKQNNYWLFFLSAFLIY
jgi:D-aspartate ligase